MNIARPTLLGRRAVVEPRRDHHHGTLLRLVGRAQRRNRGQAVVGDDTVSRLHANVVRSANGFVLSDLGSTNGTWMAGRRVGQVEVAPGDVVCLGELPLRLLE